ncbi:diguanylate cyclase domain-containing protein, partial [Enterobacter roggenkampii]|uniref:diguanylate cyclase domain-containing protein n=1 Tax=Enterobacter roggenkampii TaxID=1812935 RepID=UPI001F610740
MVAGQQRARVAHNKGGEQVDQRKEIFFRGPLSPGVAQDNKTGLNNRLFFDNQLATLLDDSEKVGTHGVVMMIRLPDFDLLRDT